MTGAWVIVHEDSPLKRAQMTYYRLGDGPFFVFYTPFHLPHVQIPSTIARAVIHRDATVAPLAGPVCEVLTIAKRDLKAGERLDGVGGFCSYGLIDNRAAARAVDAFPSACQKIACCVGMLRRTRWSPFDDVVSPRGRLVEKLWREQNERWPIDTPSTHLKSGQPPVAQLETTLPV